jgi:hypothetical protein
MPDIKMSVCRFRTPADGSILAHRSSGRLFYQKEGVNMKLLNSLYKPKVLLLVSALAAASVVGAQTTGYSNTAPPAKDTAKMNAPIDTSKPADTSAQTTAPSDASKPTDMSAQPSTGTAKMPSDSTAMDNGSAQPQSTTPAKKTAKATTGAKSAKASTATKSAKATTGTQQATNANPHNKVASASAHSTSRARAGTSGAKASSSETAYRNKLRNCQQQPADQRESCLDQVIEQTQRS